ncbi:CFEM domain, partial [Rhizoctonia solani]
MRFSTRFVVLGLFAAIASAQTPIPPTETAPTGSVTRTVSDTVTTSGTALPSSSVNGTITASGSLNSTATLSATSTTPTTTSYPSLGGASTCGKSSVSFSVSISQANCSTIIDVNCYCNSTQFRSGLVQCVASNCPQDLSSAENYGQQFCNIVSVSLTYPPAPSSTSRASSSVSPPTGAPLTTPTTTATTTPNAAAASRQVGELGWGLAAALLGVFAI